MKLVFWGLIFLFFNFDLHVGNSTITLLPAFAGYAMIYVGLGEVVECERFQEVRPEAKWAAIYSAVIWILNCTGLFVSGVIARVLAIVLSIVGLVFQIYITYYIAKGVCELEEDYDLILYAKELMFSWKVVLVCLIVSQILAWLNAGVLALITLIVFLIAAIGYVVLFYKAWKGYEE